jgi:hypothetical protein
MCCYLRYIRISRRQRGFIKKNNENYRKFPSLFQLCPALKPLEEGVENNGNRWQAVADSGLDEEEEEEEGEGEEEEEKMENGREEEEGSPFPERNKAARNL